MNLDNSGLSIGALAAKTGISVATLRAWERRHGLPIAERLPGGHRRYSQRDVDIINDIQRRRLLGSSLSAAVAAVKKRSEVPRSSLTRTVQHFLGNVAPVRLTKPTLVAMSRAIEDEASARADRPVLVAAFQSEDFRRQSSARWEELSRTSLATIVFTGSQAKRNRHRPARNGPWLVPLADEDPRLREWAVICDSPEFAACLVGTERLREPGHGTRSFEAIWTVEPMIVREATRTAAFLAAADHPTLTDLLSDVLTTPPASDAAAARTATVLINRVAAELDRVIG
jgi:DICT domain-containing protein